MERVMSAISQGASDLRRVTVIGGVTAAVIIGLLFAKPFYSATIDTEAFASGDVSQSVADQGPATETASIVASPVIDTNSQFFFGSGDGSNGYYAEQPELTLGLVRYAQMP
jgi:hypothetical protein